MPSFLRTSAGTEIWPCAVTFDCAIAMTVHYPGNVQLSTKFALPGVTGNALGATLTERFSVSRQLRESTPAMDR